MAWDYKSAQELKANGYPQRCPEGEFYFEWVKTHTHVPGMGEMLDAISDHFESLTKTEANWICECGDVLGGADNAMEAMANAWLQLAERDLVKKVKVIT